MKLTRVLLPICMAVLMIGLTCLGHQKEKELVYARTKVYMTFIIPLPMQVEYPKVNDLFVTALETWKSLVPMEYQIFNGMYGPPCSISVEYCDIHVAYPDIPYGIIGLFKPASNVLIVDTGGKDEPSPIIFRVMQHELGHAFGMPHVIGKDDTPHQKYDVFKYGCGRDIVLPEQSQAEQCIMYPMEMDTYRSIQPVEVIWATHFLMHDLNDRFVRNECTLFKDDEDYNKFIEESKKAHEEEKEKK